MEFQNENGTATKSAAATEVKNNAAQNGTAKAKTNTPANRPSIAGKDKTQPNEPAKNQTANGAEATQGASAEAKTPGTEQQAQPVQQPEKKEELNNAEVQIIKPALNLEQTVKAVEGLHRKNIQRLALIARIKTLEDFQIKLAEGSDQLENNVFQGCKLIIEDDKRNQFTTNTPNLIAMVAQFVYDACVNKLSELEAEIVFPNA